MVKPFSTAASPQPAVVGDLRHTGFNVTIQPVGRTVVLHLRGELDVATVQHARRALALPVARDASAIVLDLADLTFLDSTGIHLFLSAWRATHADRRSFVLRNPSPTALKALRLTGVDQLLQVRCPPSG